MNKPVNITKEVYNNKICIGDLINKFILIKDQKKSEVSHIFYVSSKTNILTIKKINVVTLKHPSWYNNYKFITLEHYAYMGFAIFIL